MDSEISILEDISDSLINLTYFLQGITPIHLNCVAKPMLSKKTGFGKPLIINAISIGFHATRSRGKMGVGNGGQGVPPSPGISQV